MRCRRYVFYINIGEILRRTELNIDVDTLGYLSKMHQQLGLLQFLNVFNSNENQYELIAKRGNGYEVMHTIDDFLRAVCFNDVVFYVQQKEEEQQEEVKDDFFEWYNISTILAHFGVIISAYLSTIYESEILIVLSYIFLAIVARYAISYDFCYWLFILFSSIILFLRYFEEKQVSFDVMSLIVFLSDFIVILISVHFFYKIF